VGLLAAGHLSSSLTFALTQTPSRRGDFSGFMFFIEFCAVATSGAPNGLALVRQACVPGMARN
jgi:hypothetical protein